MTDGERNLVLAMLAQAVEAVSRGDWQRAEGWCAGAWDLCEKGRIQFIDLCKSTNDVTTDHIAGHGSTARPESAPPVVRQQARTTRAPMTLQIQRDIAKVQPRADHPSHPAGILRKIGAGPILGVRENGCW